MKYEWRKKDKNIYLPKTIEVIELPEMNYITIEGEGIPGDVAFQDCVSALYAISYALKMNLKNKEGMYDYTVFPLEGFWDLNQEGRQKYEEGVPPAELKQYMKYKLMIRQPDFITNEIFQEYKESTYQKKKEAALLQLQFEQIEEGLCCQFVHIGSYDSEPESFTLMEEFCFSNGYERQSKIHKEIYISDPGRVSVEKLKTTLRFAVRRCL